ncbi:hypothetical protein IWQ62_000241 [Dispira parvispora]|uniref:Fork-head domain-containing protein n=1 Tax=Dispira parvispora TaxID=1520584 RepID=A0A9W8AWB9_9FUNG|nr:hypothetical protein IWQ62_000241 [Dispira parvispora]
MPKHIHNGDESPNSAQIYGSSHSDSAVRIDTVHGTQGSAPITHNKPIVCYLRRSTTEDCNPDRSEPSEELFYRFVDLVYVAIFYTSNEMSTVSEIAEWIARFHPGYRLASAHLPSFIDYVLMRDDRFAMVPPEVGQEDSEPYWTILPLD